LWLGVLAGVVLLGTLLRVASLDGVSRRTPDEYTYTDQANVLLDMGTAAGYPGLFANFARDPVRPA
jgi:ABC-type transporter Mla subunit MlaD